MRRFDEPYRTEEGSVRVRRKQSAYRALCNQMRNVRTAVDYFGGLGFGAAIIHECLPKSSILVYDIDPECLSAVRRRLDSPLVMVRRGDFFEVAGQRHYDLAVLDWNTFTILQYRKNKQLADAISRLLQAGPRYLLVNDGAVMMFHTHPKVYGVQTFDEYLSLLVRECFEGYALKSWVNKREVAYLLLEKKHAR